jgi:hypothetical protein
LGLILGSGKAPSLRRGEKVWREGEGEDEKKAELPAGARTLAGRKIKGGRILNFPEKSRDGSFVRGTDFEFPE